MHAPTLERYEHKMLRLVKVRVNFDSIVIAFTTSIIFGMILLTILSVMLLCPGNRSIVSIILASGMVGSFKMRCFSAANLSALFNKALSLSVLCNSRPNVQTYCFQLIGTVKLRHRMALLMLLYIGVSFMILSIPSFFHG